MICAFPPFQKHNFIIWNFSGIFFIMVYNFIWLPIFTMFYDLGLLELLSQLFQFCWFFDFFFKVTGWEDPTQTILHKKGMFRIIFIIIMHWWFLHILYKSMLVNNYLFIGKMITLLLKGPHFVQAGIKDTFCNLKCNFVII